MDYFETLGSVVNRRWKQFNYNEERFPEIAHRALNELPPHHHVTLWDVVKYAMTADSLPYQVDLGAKFGDPPLTVYTGRGFRIEVLFWTHGCPAIHQHGFSGAFNVMHGSSIHSLWEFEPLERVEMRLMLGRVSFKSAEVLMKGDTRPILAGKQMYHATYHLDRPSVSVVIRTPYEADRQPQYTLWPPAMAIAPLDEIPSIKRQTQLLKMLLVGGKRGEYHELARHLFGTKDAYSVCEYLLSTFHMIEDEEERHQLLLSAAVKHSNLVEVMRPVLLRNEIGEKILKIYRSVNISDLKYFLAVLRNVPERSAILGLFNQRYPSQNLATLVTSWMRKLSDLGVLGIRFPDCWLLMLECLLMNLSEEEIQKAFSAHSTDTGVQQSEQDLRELALSLRTSWLLQPLLTPHASLESIDTQLEAESYGERAIAV